MPYRSLFLFLLAYCLCPFGIAQDADLAQTHPLYASVVFPDRTLSRRLDQANRLLESGRTSEAAQLLGTILENADFAFLVPEKSTEGPNANTAQPIRTLRQTVFDYILDRFWQLPQEAKDSYALQFEPTAKRLLENAVLAGSLDEIHQVARKYYPTPSGASAAFLVGVTQCERGDYAAALHTLDRLERRHPSLPDAFEPALRQMLAELQTKTQNVAKPPQRSISEVAWLEQIGWRLPAGSPTQNPNTQATVPLLEQNWTVPLLTRMQYERETDAISQTLRSGNEVYIPAAQPLLVGNLLVTRTLGETIAIDTNTGKRLWAVTESEYRLPDGVNTLPLFSGGHPRSMLRLFFWHNWIAQQLSSDGEKLFSIDGHDVQADSRLAGGHMGTRPVFPGGGEDRRFDPGSTLTARNLKTGRILWQAGKFPYVQKYIDDYFAPRNSSGRPANAQANRGGTDLDENIFTDDEKNLKETWFLGAPLPLHGRLYVIGETEGVLQLFMLESQTGRLVGKQAFAHSQHSVAANAVRRTYPLFPSASEGIVICPTGNGLVAALDATTLSPIWCYTYPPTSSNSVGGRRGQMQQQLVPGININEQTLMQLFNESGWQVPSIIVDRQRVLVAPPDRATVYCLDLLSGNCLWQQTFTRSNTLYVACVHNDKAFLVTPTNIMALDMSNNGKEVSFTGHRFPSTVKPVGIGVHSGSQYFIPFTEGRLAVADLDEGKLTWLDASGLAVQSPDSGVAPTSISASPPATGYYDYGGSQGQQETDMFSPDLKADDIFQKPTQFGNLVGIKGRFFSQSPTQVTSFDQKEPLRQRAEVLLQDDPNDPEGLLKQGRILKSEGKLTEAIDSFRASLKSRPTVEAADLLRKNLLEVIRKDYVSWAHACRELESLAEFPDELGTILYAQIEGILQSGRTDDLTSVLVKFFDFGQEQTILIPVSNDYSAQLHRALGGLIDQNVTKGSRPELKVTWDQLAETFLRRMAENPTVTAKPTDISGQSPQWIRNVVYLPPQIQRWLLFTHIFRNTPATEKAKLILGEEYERYRLSIALNLLERPAAVSDWTELPAPFAWKMDHFYIEDSAGTTTPDSPNPYSVPSAHKGDEVDRSIKRLVSLAKNPVASRLSGHQLVVPFLGPPDSNFSACEFAVKSWATEYFLSCSDLSGQEQWRLTLPISFVGSDAQSNRQGGEYSAYVKGIRNYLLFAHGNSMTAIDATPQAEKVLWSKTLSSPFMVRQNSNDRRLGYSQPQQRMTENAPFPKNSLFISSQVICCWDTNCAYGLDPLTGQTLWVRKFPYDTCTILGDEENLFLVFPEMRLAIAVDPASGRELASAPIPSGGTYTFRTNIVFTEKRGNEFTLLLGDLRDMHDKRRRALLLADSPNGKITPPIPTEILHNKLHSASLIQSLRADRFVSVATWATKTLQIYDLQTKKNLLPEENKLLEFVPEKNNAGNEVGLVRCDVELVGDRFLVLCTRDTNFRDAQEPHPELPDVISTFQPMNGVACIGVGEGTVMLFDSDGNPCWSEPTAIKNLSRLLDVPDRLPVMLFGVSVMDRKGQNRAEHSTGIAGVDKRSGKFLFRKVIPAVSQVPMQMFRVGTDPLAQEITFTAANALPTRVVKVVFGEETRE